MSRAPSSIGEGLEIAGRYILREPIASGGMAQVWRADDTVLGRAVAVKLLHPHLAGDDDFVERFRTEAKAAARLTHPSIVAIYDTASEAGVEAIVMELIDGITLRRYLDEYGALSIVDAVDLATQVADALDAAHQARLVHRDIKPGNILLCPDRRVKVTDFGIAKILEDADRTAAGTLLGTAKYLAPEQVEGAPVDQRTDLYALGVVLYEALTGRPPFVEETDAATALARLREHPVPPRALDASIPAALERVVLTAMARDPAHRYPDAVTFAAALTAAAEAPMPTPVADDVVPPPVPLVDPTAVDDTMVEPERDPTATGPIPLAKAPQKPSSEDQPRRATRSRRRTALLVATIVIGAASLGVGLILATSAGRDFAGRAIDAVASDEATDDNAPTQGEPIADDSDDDEAPATAPDLDDNVDEITVERPALPIAAVDDFDPFGDGEERPDLTAFMLDGDLGTSWKSEGYDNRAFGNLKEGIGVIVELPERQTLTSLVVTASTQGWAAQVFIADDVPDSLGGWGQSVDGRTAIEGGAEFDLRRVQGRYVLLWVTDLGDAPPRLRMEIAELRVT